MPPELTLNVAAQVSLSGFTSGEMVVPVLREHDTAGIIGELSRVLHVRGCVGDVLPLYHSALNRELLSSSAVESGLAFPHARLSEVKQLQFALGRTSAPVSWCGKHSWPVRLVFLLAVPATDAAGYLHLLASLARLGQQPDAVNDLLRADTAEGMMAVLRRFKVRGL